MLGLEAYIKVTNTKEILIENAVLDLNRVNLPDYGGIYFVFTGIVEERENGFIIKHPTLVYIGKAKDINERHNDEKGNPIHEHYKDFMASLKSGEQICYAFARIDAPYTRGLIESALVYQFQPIINIQLKQTYTHRAIHLVIKANHEFPYVGEWDINQAE